MYENLKELIRLEKHQWIAELAADKSFIDVGGLWGTVNETVTIAKLAGAKSVAMADIQPFDSKWWKAFDERCQEYGVTDVDKIQMDICSSDSLVDQKKYDFVHCAGIMYHVSDPIQFIQNLISISNEYLLISSMTIPEKIENKHGVILTPEGTCNLIPLLTEEKREVIKHYLQSRNINPKIADKRSTEYLFRTDRRVRTGPWWWIYSPKTMERMCELCGLEVIKSHTNKNNRAHSVLCHI